MQDRNHGCGVYRFTPADKVIGNVALYAGVFIGAWAMFLASPWPALGYLAYVFAGLALVVRYTVCARCPHLLGNRDCLFVPPALAVRLISRSRTGALNFGEYVILFAVFVGMALIPLYWLLPHALLLGVYVLAQVFLALTFRRNLCRKCCNGVCPLNKSRTA